MAVPRHSAWGSPAFDGETGRGRALRPCGSAKTPRRPPRRHDLPGSLRCRLLRPGCGRGRHRHTWRRELQRLELTGASFRSTGRSWVSLASPVHSHRAMHPPSRLPRSTRGPRAYLAVLGVTPLLALASAQALTEPEPQAPDALGAQAGTTGIAGSGSGGAAGSGSGGLGGGSPGGRSGSSGRDGARPLDGSLLGAVDATTAEATSRVAEPQLPTTLRRGVHLENGSEQAPGDQAGSSVMLAPAADLMVTANGSCGDEADQVGVVRNPRDRAP